MSDIAKQLALADSPKAFFNAIPTDLHENIAFRVKLHTYLAGDEKAQDFFLGLCRTYLPIAFNTTLMTYDPDRIPSKRNQPFILYPNQVPAVEELSRCLDEATFNKPLPVGIVKNRREGASEICIKTFTLKALLDELSNFIVGSRTEELVDKAGELTTLFAKADNVMDYLPTWWKKQCGYDKRKDRVHRMLRIPYNNSRLVGVTTNENFNAGSRGVGILLDEFGRVESSLAKSIEGSIQDIAPCIVYSSTHWLGENHPFNLALENPYTTVISLMWYDNPTENMGLYTTSEPGKYEIIDKEYYADKDMDNALVLDNIYQWNKDETRPQFVADGLRGIPSPYRAPWFDYQELYRKGDKRNFICNVCGSPLGSSEAPFDHGVLEEIKKKFIRHYDYKGELYYELDSNELVDEESIEFFPDYGANRLKWWGELINGRPTQRHNYIIACDPSYGLGSANSSAMIVDVNLREQVGSWTDANTKPEDFADYMVALAYWIGGINDCYLIWESSGGCGSMFSKRIEFQGYPAVYTQRREDSKTRKKTDKLGFNMANANVKDAILGELGVALSGGLTIEKYVKTGSAIAGTINHNRYKALIIHDAELLSELRDYIFREKGAGAVCSSKADLSTGALARHGDRVISAALCVLGYNEQLPGNPEDMTYSPIGSFAYYERQREKKKAKDKRELRRVLF